LLLKYKVLFLFSFLSFLLIILLCMGNTFLLFKIVFRLPGTFTLHGYIMCSSLEFMKIVTPPSWVGGGPYVFEDGHICRCPSNHFPFFLFMQIVIVIVFSWFLFVFPS
jgi:hypothetical protein